MVFVKEKLAGKVRINKRCGFGSIIKTLRQTRLFLALVPVSDTRYNKQLKLKSGSRSGKLL
jgi:hypothetical protein